MVVALLQRGYGRGSGLHSENMMTRQRHLGPGAIQEATETIQQTRGSVFLLMDKWVILVIDDDKGWRGSRGRMKGREKMRRLLGDDGG